MTKPQVTHTKCRCTVCGDFFNSAAAFDKHRTDLWGLSADAFHTKKGEQKRWMSIITGIG